MQMIIKPSRLATCSPQGCFEAGSIGSRVLRHCDTAPSWLTHHHHSSSVPHHQPLYHASKCAPFDRWKTGV